MAEDGSLKIQKLAMEDGGMFQCVAANSAGEASAYTWLKVKSEWLVDTGWFAQTGCLLFFLLFFLLLDCFFRFSIFGAVSLTNPIRFFQLTTT